MLAQSAHAATAVLHLYRDHPDVRRYLEGVEGDGGRGWEVMRKVTYEVRLISSLSQIYGRQESEGSVCFRKRTGP